ncbi:MAG: hypothetical protein AABX51_07355 [Nanoarchaeota archaeon]
MALSFSSCKDYECKEQYFAQLTKTRGTDAAFSDLKERYKNDSFVRAYCHQYSHAIGRAAAENSISVADAFAIGDSFCWSGYYHGVMETYLAKEKKEDIPSKINSFCSEVPGKSNYSFDYYNCVHGLGHGVMFISGNELFDALELCNSLNGLWEQQSCWSGIFMENVMTDNKDHFTKYLIPDQPLYPCSAVKKKYKSICFLMQTSYMLKIANYNYSRVFEYCGAAGGPYIDYCYQSLGRDASGNSVSDVERTRTTCMLGKNYRQQSNCVIGAVKDFISYHHSDIQAKRLCASLPMELQEVCSTTAEEYYKTFWTQPARP